MDADGREGTLGREIRLEVKDGLNQRKIEEIE